MEKVTFIYNYSIVLISILIAIFSCFTTLDLLGRVQNASEKKQKMRWLAASAAMMGIGTWSMHFMAMLAIETDALVVYNSLFTFLSLLASVILSFASFYVLSFKKLTLPWLIFSAGLLGAAKAAMHYIGMYGVVTDSVIEYHPTLVGLSIAAGILLSFFSLYFFSKVMRESFSIFYVPISGVLALSICVTHYLGMASVTFYKSQQETGILQPKVFEFMMQSNSVLVGIVLVNFLIVGVVHSLSIRDRKNHEAKVNYMAYYDQLTGLPNRIKFNQAIQDFIKEAKELRQPFAVLFIDLDRFKHVNDTLGHEYGDQFLIKVGKRLSKNVGFGDVVARHGGDEFILLLKNANAVRAKQMAERIFDSFTNPFIIKEKEVFTTASIGIGLYPEHGEDTNSLMRHSYKAMYLAQQRGYNNYQFYIREDDSILDRKIKIEQGLKRALHNNEFELHFQPQIYLKTRQIVGVEALLRWEHPELGKIPPMEFIPVAESTGLIIPIGKWVIHEACKQIRLWQGEGIPIKIAVNVSALQFEDHQFIEIINEALHQNVLPPKYLELEITESVMQKINQSSIIINKLKNIGVKVSIDDFGTGYSSLSVLSSLPIDVIKIDKSFVNRMMDDPNTASLVKTMIEMGNNLNFGLIAEGIESEEQAEFLIRNGCHYGQGYLYSRPVTKEEIEKLLSKKHVV